MIRTSKLKLYKDGAWTPVGLSGGGTGGGGGGTTTFDTNFSIKMSGVKAVASGAYTKIDKYDTIIIDGNTEWDAANLRWVCKTTGTYIINATLAWTAAAGGYRNLYIYIDGASVQGNSVAGVTGVSNNNIILYKKEITAGQYVELYGLQNSGGSLNAIVGTTPFEWQIWRYK
jgi:hypothetical protein